MTYQVLARKWRPRIFAEVIGQQHVLKALINALDSNRLHHAYLFTGTRGVGKTTLARVLAKALNCDEGVSSRPCGVCSACQEIDQGRFVDLIEVDAASRTKVDETRDLLDNVQYAPTRARYKVYLIDEVHMFSNHSFNALLKTLEEPPAHVKFLLATTDPKKLPVTILSRCLQFNLTRLSPSMLAQHLGKVLTAEGIEYEDSALALIAQAAGGSVRDALSLLDQAIAHGGGRIDGGEVAIMLGTVDQERVIKLLATLCEGDAYTVIADARGLAQYAPDYAQVLAELLSLLRRVAVAQALGAQAADVETEPRVLDLAGRLPPEDCQLLYQIALTGRRDLAISPDFEAAFEMTLLRMLAFRPAGDGVPTSTLPAAGSRSVPAAAGLARSAPAVSRAAPPPRVPEADPPPWATESVETAAAAEPARASMPPEIASPAPLGPATAAAPVETPAHSPPRALDGDDAFAPQGSQVALDWGRVVDELAVVGLARELARNSAVAAFDGRRLELVIAPQFERLAARRTVETLQAALRERLADDLVINLAVRVDEDLETPSQQLLAAAAERQRRAQAEIDGDPNVQALRDAFGATVEEVTSR